MTELTTASKNEDDHEEEEEVIEHAQSYKGAVPGSLSNQKDPRIAAMPLCRGSADAGSE